jgi:hypothetical protein
MEVDKMRAITVSTDVYARIWSLRMSGEDSEDAILRRVLECPGELGDGGVSQAFPQNQDALSGVMDRRFGVHFPEGFEIFRNYLGRDYRARASTGNWRLIGSNLRYPSLNELSRGIGAKVENAWMNWFYLDPSGQKRPVSSLRDPSKILARKKYSIGLTPQVEPEKVDAKMSNINITWRDDVFDALKILGGKSDLGRIYKEVEGIRKATGRSVPPTLDAVVRRTLEDHSSDSRNYRGGPDLFYMPEGHGAGVWALR